MNYGFKTEGMPLLPSFGFNEGLFQIYFAWHVIYGSLQSLQRGIGTR